MQISSRILLLVALLLFLAAGAFWLASGANRGWTKTSVPKIIVDDVTGIEGRFYEKRFVPGIDFLAAALLGSAILAGASFLLRKKRTQIST